MHPDLFSSLTKLASPEKAEEIRQSIAKKHKVTPFLYGSVPIGLNLPGKYDFDYGIRVTSPERFHDLHESFSKQYYASKNNEPGSDIANFKTKIEGQPVDITLLFGEKGKKLRDSTRELAAKLPEEKKKAIVEKKQSLKDSWFFPEARYYRYKTNLRKELGLYEPKRDKLPLRVDEDSLRRLARADIYGHRTQNLEPIIASGELLTAAQAHKKGVLKSVESNNPLSFARTEEHPKELRSEIFLTKGILPAGIQYGRYGILMEKKKVTPSKYLNFIPEEYTADKAARKLTFVVPDDEFYKWKKKYPDRQIIAESHVPKDKRLPAWQVHVPFKRLLLPGATPFNKTQRVEKGED